MPSHPDRVRRNYHDITIKEFHVSPTNEQLIQIRISRVELATQMSVREMKNHLGIFFRKAIENQYREK